MFYYTLSPIKNKKVDLQNKSFKYQQLHLGDGLYKVVKVVLHKFQEHSSIRSILVRLHTHKYFAVTGLGVDIGSLILSTRMYCIP